MHVAETMKNWSHHLHDGMLTMRHHIWDHLHNRHFWAGIGVALVVIGILTVLFFAAKNAPIQYSYPYFPYGAY